MYSVRIISCVVLSTDINECEVYPGICGLGTCINTVGDYTCDCPDGHLLMPDKNCMGKYGLQKLCSSLIRSIYNVSKLHTCCYYIYNYNTA